MISRTMFEPLIHRIAQQHGTTMQAVFSSSRYRTVALARAHAMAVVRWSTDLSLPEIGRLFNRDHTTVINAIRKWEAHLNGDEPQ